MEPPVPARRCWTLNYADGAQFHMDVLPAVPDGQHQRRLLKTSGLHTDWAELAVAITDVEHPNYRILSDDWPASNPKGYAEWFRSRMLAIFEAKRRALALAERRADIEEIPEYRVKTPLEFAVQILKRHRDLCHRGSGNRPISIIITTLAAHAYDQETTISGALYGILEKMDSYIEDRNGVAWVANPTDPRENFADKWAAQPRRLKTFYDWLKAARADFGAAARFTNVELIVDTLAPRMGRRLVESAANKRQPCGVAASMVNRVPRVSTALRRILDAPHRLPPTWPQVSVGSVAITSATASRNGIRPHNFASDSARLSKNSALLSRRIQMYRLPIGSIGRLSTQVMKPAMPAGCVAATKKPVSSGANSPRGSRRLMPARTA